MEPWKIMICDDDETIHELSSFVLSRYEFQNRKLHLIHAYSEEDCINLLKEHPDTAVILLDMIMDSDDSGYQCLKGIRQELTNPLVRIVIRSGFTDMEIPHKLMEEFDISDFREKTELTSAKLNLVISSALSNYQTLSQLDKEKKKLMEPLEFLPADHQIFQKMDPELLNLIQKKSIKREEL